MNRVTLEQIKQLREKTKAGVMDCRQALEECGGDLKKAEEWLRKKGIASARKKAGRQAEAGLVEAYVHPDSRIASVVELACETDFVARNEEFKKLAHELALQVAAMSPKNVAELLKQPWIRDEKITIGDLIAQTIAKLGENIVVRRIFRCELGVKT
ncbi:MAG: translation elongation factor Ts [Microgenomates group bacterium]